MFKRVERKRKRREEEEELGLDEDMREIVGLNDTDSDESSQSDAHSDSDAGAQAGEEEDVVSEDEGIVEEPSISVEEALRDPIYLVSLADSTVYGCVLCKGKRMKNEAVITAHKNANVHKRRFERFRLLSGDADPSSSAWGLVKTTPYSTSNAESQKPSKRAFKRQVRQAAMREKRERHKELKAKAIAKKASKKLPVAEETKLAAPSKANVRRSPEMQNQSRKSQKLENKTIASTTRDVTAKPASRTEHPNDSKNLALKPRIKGTRKVKQSS